MKKLMLAVMAMAAASAFGSFSYQGALKLADGAEVTDLTKTITLRLYTNPTDNNVLWAGVQTVMLAEKTGLFNIEVSDLLERLKGDDARLPIDDVIAAHANETLYLGIEVAGSAGEIRPRQKLLAVPTASFAHNVKKAADNFTVMGGTICQGPVEAQSKLSVKGTLEALSDATVSGNVSVAGKISVNGKITRNDSEVLPVPVGGVIMWTKATAPDGEEWATDENEGHWVVCDGRTIAGQKTPDLRGRFVVGVNDTTAGSSKNNAWKLYSVGNAGGEETHKLTVEEMPVHSHLYGMDSAFRASSNWNSGSLVVSGQFSGYKGDNSAGSWIRTGTAGGDSTDKKAGTDNTAHNNLPPYYALYYIMRVR